MLVQFPFERLGFHTDNGSEYINYQVAALLEKLRVEFTRSRPRKSNDNTLVESKNGTVVRKVSGGEHIPQQYAERFNAFCLPHLNPFLNFHRRYMFATDVPDLGQPSRIHRVYYPKDAMTPPAKLASLPQPARYLRPGIIDRVDSDTLAIR